MVNQVHKPATHYIAQDVCVQHSLIAICFSLSPSPHFFSNQYVWDEKTERDSKNILVAAYNLISQEHRIPWPIHLVTVVRLAQLCLWNIRVMCSVLLQRQIPPPPPHTRTIRFTTTTPPAPPPTPTSTAADSNETSVATVMSFLVRLWTPQCRSTSRQPYDPARGKTPDVRLTLYS